MNNWELKNDCIQGVGVLSKYIISRADFGVRENRLLKKSILHFARKADVNESQVKELIKCVIDAFELYEVESPGTDWFENIYEDYKKEMYSLSNFSKHFGLDLDTMFGVN